MRITVFAAVVYFVAFACVTRAAEDVPRAGPKQYTDRLAALLTPTDEAMKHRTDKVPGDASASSLATETARYVDGSGRSWIAVHQIDLARTDEGVSQVARTVFPFRKSNQKIYLALARSIQADGTFNPVANNAVLVQTPQNDQDASLYSDQAELVVVFPNVKANTACESIIVIETTTPTIPGEFTATLQFSSNWYHWRRRNVVELPGSMAQRLTITPIGSVPAPRREVLGDGAVRLTWERERLAGEAAEVDRAPDEQAGPVVYLSTLKSWDALGDWYRTKLQGRDSAGKELAHHLAERVRGLTDRDAILAALLTDVARDVRYTGLEFGAAGLQPYDPNDVWTNRYGDCKDKANLLRTMLRAMQIPADLALVNTEHAGRIEKRSPDIRQFDHMIVAIEKPGGGYLFCDPTITYAKPGMLRPDDIDRDVLVLKDKGVEFVHTPAQEIGAVHYEFDLKLAANGSLAGWLTMNADGYVGESLAEYYSVKDRQVARSRTSDLVQSFFKSAEVIDLDPLPIEKYADTYRLRAYFTTPEDGAAQRPLNRTFPGADDFLPELGEQKSRQTDYWQSRRVRTVHCRIQLPAGWTISDAPLPFSVRIGPVAAAGGWTIDHGALIANLEYSTTETLVSTKEYPSLYNAIASLRAWLGKSATFGPGGTNMAMIPAASQPALSDFPMLPTGDGQLDLVERNYPLDGDPALRRRALQTVLQWFPDDRQTQFIANVRLLELDERDHPKDAALLDRMQRLIAATGNGFDPDTRSWAQYLQARWLTAAERKPEALVLFNQLAADPANTDARRGWASYRGAQLEDWVAPQKAITLVESTLSLDTGILPTQFSEIAPLLLREKMASRLQADLETLAQRSPDDLDKVAAALADDAKQYAGEDEKQPLASQLLDVLDKLIAAHPPLSHLREQVDALRARLGNLASYRKVVVDLKAYLDQHRPTWWSGAWIDPSLTSRESYKGAIQRAHDATPVEPFIRYTLEYLIRFSPDPDDFGERIWRLAAVLQAQSREPAVLDELFVLADELPETDRWRWEAALVHARVLSDRNDVPAALDLLRQVQSNEKVGRAIRWAAYRYSGEYLETLHRYDDALAIYKLIESDLEANNKNCEGLLRAVFLNLERGDFAEAARICPLLARIAESERNASPNARQISDLIAISNDPAGGEKFWRRQTAWWPLWQEIEQRTDAPADEQPLIPLIPDPSALEQQIIAAVQAGDRRQFFLSCRVLAHAARWEPRHLIKLAELITQAVPLMPQQQTQWRELIVKALTGLESSDPTIVPAAKFWLAAYLIDLNRAPDALQIIKDYLADAGQNDMWRQAIHRLWAIAASDPDDLKQALAAMQADLDAPAGVANRSRTVTCMADAYHRLGQRDLEMALLKRELSNPAIKADAVYSPLLSARYRGLLNMSDNTAEISAAITQWITRQKPAWYDFARPHVLADLGRQDPMELLKNPPATLLAAEVAKIGLLVAQDPARSKQDRVWAFNAALRQLTELCLHHDDVAALTVPILDDERFPDDSRQYWLMNTLEQGPTVHGLAMLRLKPLFSTLSMKDRQELDAFGFFNASWDSPQMILRFLDQALASPMDPVRLEQFERVFYRLAQLDPPAARSVYAGTNRLELSPGAAETAAAIRLKLLRDLRLEESYQPAFRAAARLVLDRFQPMHLQSAGDPASFRSIKDLELCDPKDALAVRLWAIEGHRFNSSDFGFWANLIDQVPRSMLDLPFRANLFQAFLMQLPEDKPRSDVIFLSGSFFDFDDASHRQRLMELLAPYRDSKRYPYSSGVIRQVDASLALRDGKPANVDDVMRDQKSALPKMDEMRERLAMLLQRRDPQEIKAYFTGLNADVLAAPDEIALKLQALKIAGLADEAEIVRDAAREEIYREALASWSHPKGYQIRDALRLAVLLDDEHVVPAAWIEYCRAHIQNEALQANINMRVAELHHDWSGALAAANEQIAYRPAFYDYYWDKAKALFHLGRNREAADSVGIFMSHCKDEAEYVDATEMLGAISAK